MIPWMTDVWSRLINMLYSPLNTLLSLSRFRVCPYFLVHNPVPNGLHVHNHCFEKLYIFSLVPRPLPDFPSRLQDKIWEWPGEEANIYSLNAVMYLCLQKPTMLTVYLSFGMWVLNSLTWTPQSACPVVWSSSSLLHLKMHVSNSR